MSNLKQLFNRIKNLKQLEINDIVEVEKQDTASWVLEVKKQDIQDTNNLQETIIEEPINNDEEFGENCQSSVDELQ